MIARDLIRDLGKRHSEAVAMLVGKEAEQPISESKPDLKHPAEKPFSFETDHLKGACFHCEMLGQYKRDCRILNGRRNHHKKGDGVATRV